MSLLKSHPWEAQLLGFAREPLNSPDVTLACTVSQSELDAAYRTCAGITRRSSRTFFLASALLPPAKQRAARALYAMCRTTDDIVDDIHCSVAERREALAQWQAMILSDHVTQPAPVCLAWVNTQLQFNIPRGYTEQLILGCARDLEQNRDASFAELAEYAYGVASTVGLMAMHITGFLGEDALPYAVRLGIALQMTNILRDVATDWQSNRVYLPQDELAAHGLTEEDLDRGVVDRRWRAFMQFQINRNRELYRDAIQGIALLEADGRFAIAAAAQLYRAILDDIERHDYDVFSRRAHIGTAGKLMRLPAIWWYCKRVKLNP
jgi:15-cis-phytoene synthase